MHEFEFESSQKCHEHEHFSEDSEPQYLETGLNCGTLGHCGPRITGKVNKKEEGRNIAKVPKVPYNMEINRTMYTAITHEAHSKFDGRTIFI